jgi:hypothetical protein
MLVVFANHLQTQIQEILIEKFAELGHPNHDFYNDFCDRLEAN